MLPAHGNVTHSRVDNETREGMKKKKKAPNPANVPASTAGQSQREMGVDVTDEAELLGLGPR